MSAARPTSGPAVPRQTVEFLAASLVALHCGSSPTFQGLDPAALIGFGPALHGDGSLHSLGLLPAETTWCYTSVLNDGRWLRHLLLSFPDCSGIKLRGDEVVTLERAQALVSQALGAGRIEIWVAAYCGPEHGWWEFAPVYRARRFKGYHADVAQWGDASEPLVPVRVALAGRTVRHVWLVEDDIARPLAAPPATG